MEILRKFIFGDIFSNKTLDAKQRELITVTTLATQQTLPQLKAHIMAAINAGVKPIEIREALYQLAPFIGFPKTLNAVSCMNEAFAQMGVPTPPPAATVNEDNRFEKGLAIQQPIYGDEIEKKYPDVPQIPKYLTEFGFGDFYTREGLSLQQRELLVLVVLTTIRSDSQIAAHLLGNLKVGNSKQTIIAAMLQCLPYIGFPNTMNTINILQSLDKK